MSSRATTVVLYKDVPLTRDYSDVYTSTALLNGFTHITLTNLSYQRIYSHSLKLPLSSNGLVYQGAAGMYPHDITYISITNPNDTTFYAFVDGVDYVSDACVELTYSIDYFMTYVSSGKVSFGQCFIERENVNSADDTVGNHILSEPVELGDYKDVYYNRSNWYGSAVFYIDAPFDMSNVSEEYTSSILVAYGANDGSSGNYTFNYPTGVETMAFESAQGAVSYMDTHKEKIRQMDLRIAPSVGYNEVINVTRPANLDGYIPSNNKLLTYPYICCQVKTPVGTSQSFPYEFFTGSRDFRISADATPNGCIYCYPLNYNGSGSDKSGVMTISNLPSLPTNTNLSEMTRAQQEAELPSNLANIVTSGIRGAAIGSATQTPVGAIGGALLGAGLSAFQIGTTRMNESNTAAITGNNIVNYYQGSGVGWCASRFLEFYFYRRTIRYELAKKIDDFFTAFGYHVGKIAIPQITNTKYSHHYVKTIGCVVRGSAPEAAKKIIKTAMDGGVRFWKKATIGEYFTQG